LRKYGISFKWLNKETKVETLVKYSKDREDIKWDDKYSIGISMIDEEHKKLIGILNKAIFAKEHNDNPEEIKEVLGEMDEYSHKHFSIEEAYMIKFNFPEYQSHRNEHLDFTSKTIASYNKLVMGDSQIASLSTILCKPHISNYKQASIRSPK
jgi:hemerythrin